MTADENLLYYLAFVAGLIFLHALFVAGEYGLVRSNPAHLRSTEGRRRWGSQTALKLVEEMDVSLSATQLGITLCTLMVGWIGEQSIAPALHYPFDALTEPIRSFWAHGLATVLAVFFLLTVHLIFGEFIAKSIAIKYPEPTLRLLSGPMICFRSLTRPVIVVYNKLAKLFLGTFGIRNLANVDQVHSLTELTFLLSKSTEGGVLDKEEEQMVRGIFGLSDTVAREVMTPRADLVTIPIDSTLEEVVNTIRESGLSRFPVSGETNDDILGVLLSRDILSFVVPGLLTANRNKEEFSVKKLMRAPYFIAETKRIDDLLSEFKHRKLHLAIVLDEHGGVNGVVTLEDLIEEIVGDIFDESDVPEKSIRVDDNGDVLIDGGQLVADLNLRFGLEIPEGDYDTVAGFIFTALGRMPRPGDSITIRRSARQLAGADLDEIANSNQELLNSADPLAESSEQLEDPDLAEAKAILTVESVQSFRIETVRLTSLLFAPEPESESKTTTSEQVE